MKYYSEDTVKEIIEDTVNATLHICKPKADYPYIEIKEPHGRLVDIDRMISQARTDKFPIDIHSAEELADFLEIYADLDKTDHTIVIEASKERE